MSHDLPGDGTGRPARPPSSSPSPCRWWWCCCSGCSRWRSSAATSWPSSWRPGRRPGAAAVSADPVGAATTAARRATRLEPIDVAVELIGDAVRVTVRFVDPTDMALIGDVIAPVALQATAVMALEPPAPSRTVCPPTPIVGTRRWR